jgi:hypothetical protein
MRVSLAILTSPFEWNVEIRKGWRDFSQPAFMFGVFLSVSTVPLTPFALGRHAAVIVRFENT